MEEKLSQKTAQHFAQHPLYCWTWQQGRLDMAFTLMLSSQGESAKRVSEVSNKIT